MNRRPVFASILFVGLSAAGVFALFSQTEPTNGALRAETAGQRWMSLNPGSGRDELRNILPAVIDESSRVDRGAEESADENAQPPRKRLRLR